MTEKADIERLRGIVNQDLFREPARGQRDPKIGFPERFVHWVAPERSPSTDPVLRAWISELLHG